METINNVLTEFNFAWKSSGRGGLGVYKNIGKCSEGKINSGRGEIKFGGRDLFFPGIFSLPWSV